MSTSSPAVLAVSAFIAVRLLVLLTLVVMAQEQGRSAYRVLVKWDAQWYAGVAELGYGFTLIRDTGQRLSDYAFFPLFPLLERGVAAAVGIAYVDAGLLVSAVSAILAAWGIFAVAGHLYGNRTGVLTTVLWASLPVGIVQTMAYSESLFTAFAAWALYAVLTGRWVRAGLLACCAGLTRPVGAAVVAAVVVQAGVHYVRRSRTDPSDRIPRRQDLRPLAGALAAPLGWLGYVAWVGVEVGSPIGYLKVASGWRNGFDGGTAFAGWIWSLVTGPAPVSGGLVLMGLASLVWLGWLCLRTHQPLPLLVFTGVLCFLALTTAGYFGSKPRYLMPAFPLLIPLAHWLAGLRARISVILVAALTAVAAVYGAVWLLGTGPP